jgi:hypothetical protein
VSKAEQETASEASGRIRAAGWSDLVPESQSKYYEQLHDKHFNQQTAVGSVFNPALKDLATLLALAANEPGGLERDDRDHFVALGVSREALIDECRYLMVQVPGEIGLIKAKDVKPNKTVRVVRTKDNLPCSLVVRKADFIPVEYGTIIIGPDGTRENKEHVWTAHPGPPIPRTTEDIWPEGSVITAQDVIDRLGEDAWLQIEVN